MTAPSPAAEDRRRSGRWKWGLLAVSILILACYGGFRLYYLWSYVQPTTLEEVCGLSKYHSLDGCEQVYIRLSRYPVETKHGVSYQTQYQVLTPEDACFDLVMDFTRGLIFRRTLAGKLHPSHEIEDDWSISISFYDGAGLVPSLAEHSWDKQADRIAEFYLSRHCVDERCIFFSRPGLPGENYPSGASEDFYDPLVEIMETVTSEKGDWIWEKEPY